MLPRSLLPFLLLVTASARSQKIDPEHPDLSPGNFKLDSLPNSEINVPIQVNLKPFYQMAEKSVDTVFTSPGYPDNWVYDGCDVRYKYILRRSPLRISGVANMMTLGFTGFYKIAGSTRVCVKGTVLSPWTPPCKCGFSEPERRVNVSFTNTFSLQPDFKVKLTVRRNEPEPRRNGGAQRRLRLGDTLPNRFQYIPGIAHRAAGAGKKR